MNVIFKSCFSGYRALSYFKPRYFCEVINTSRYTKSINKIEFDAKKNIDSVFAKESISSDKVHELFNEVSVIMSQNYNFLIKSLLDRIWEQIGKKKVKVDISHYNKTMEMYFLNDIDFNPLEILKEVNKNKISYNNITFDLLLKKYCQLGDYQSAMKLVDKMIQSHMFINGTKNAWLIGCAIRANKEEEIDKYYEEVKSKNLIFTHATYAFIAEAYASKNDVENCIRVYRQAESILGAHPRSLQYKYRSYFELAKNGADEDLLAKMINYIDHKENYDVFIAVFKRLSRAKLFSAVEFLVRNVKIPLKQENYEFLAKWSAPLKPPLEYMQYLIAHSDNPNLHVTIIRFLSPFEEAFKIVEKLVENNGNQFLRKILSNIMFNASNSPNTIPKMKFILNFFNMRFQDIDFNTCLISAGIDHLLLLHPGQSYPQLLSTFANTDDYQSTMRLIMCCMVHGLCKGRIDCVQQLLDQYPDCVGKKLNFYNRDVGFLLARDKSLEELSQCIKLGKTVLQTENYNYLMVSVLNQFANIHSTEELNEFVAMFKDDFPYPMKEFEFIKDNKKLSAEKLAIIKNFQSEDNKVIL